jgi:hypothetical protein
VIRQRILTLLVALAVLAVVAGIGGLGSLRTSAIATGDEAAASGAVAAATATPRASLRTAPGALPSASPQATSSPGAEPSPTAPAPRATPPAAVSQPGPPAGGPYSMNLYRPGDFVSQATKDQCVSAAMQIMINVIAEQQDRSPRTQAVLARLANELSDAPDGGTEPRGWSGALSQLDYGSYRVSVARSRSIAIRRAVIALRETGRPVGLLVWRGAHSWVLHGFRATADPALTDDFGITGLYLSDPWYPRISSIWGPSRAPNALVRPAALREDYLPWHRPSGPYPGWDGNFVLVLPVGRA